MNSELLEKLETLAMKKSTPFCYSCYQKAPTGVCPTCGSDDLMRITKDNGPEYGTDWIISDLLATLTPIDTEEAFEESVRSCYPETIQVGWMTLDTVSVMKDQDPTSWNIALTEYIDSELENDAIFTLDNGIYYSTYDVEALIETEGD